jgi:uncharacterized protein (DUF1919 family)
MYIFKKIKHSIQFRYKHWLKQRQAKRLAYAMALHQNKMKAIIAIDFTIISANCWGGSVYEDLELPY